MREEEEEIKTASSRESSGNVIFGQFKENTQNNGENKMINNKER